MLNKEMDYDLLTDKNRAAVEGARVIQVIQTTTRRGDGTEGSPVRIIQQYWNFEGKLLAEYDNILPPPIPFLGRVRST
jgi:hypothetical protein